MFEPKVIAPRDGVPLRAAKGHFATNHSHINYFIDITTQKTRLAEAKAVARGPAVKFANTRAAAPPPTSTRSLSSSPSTTPSTR